MPTATSKANGKAEASSAPPTTSTTGLVRMRDPFPADHISKLPKQVSRDDREKERCKPGTRASADGTYCGGWHARSVHLDYVGHSDITDRLLDADPAWNWEPAYRNIPSDVLIEAVRTGNPEIVRMVLEAAPPLFDRDGGMWMKLTVDGVTRLGYGDAQGKSGPNAIKEVIGDGLRNASMRFGAALELWSKADHADRTNDSGESEPTVHGRGEPPAQPESSGRDWLAEIKQITELDQLLALGKECNAFGEFVGDVKKAMLDRRAELEKPAET